jgi:hypothetical protein
MSQFIMSAVRMKYAELQGDDIGGSGGTQAAATPA